MTQFEFLMTFASVVLAIALTEMLGGWGKLIRSRLPIRWSGLWIGWSLVIVSNVIMYWSGMWPYRDQSFREGYKIYWLAIPTFFLVVLGYLLSPSQRRVRTRSTSRSATGRSRQGCFRYQRSALLGPCSQT